MKIQSPISASRAKTNGQEANWNKILKRAGRLKEIEAEQAKLPAEIEPKIAVNQFAEAGKLENTERERAREIYKEAFAKLLKNPLTDGLKAADIAGYARTMREEKPLDEINAQLWTLREKLTAIAGENNSTDAIEARKRLSVLDGAIVDAVGDIAKTVATDDELAALHASLSAQLDDDSRSPGRDKIVALIQDLSRRAGFGDLEETILVRKLEAANLSDERQNFLRNLIDFYNERGAYQRIFDALEKYNGDDLPLKADAARLVGNREKELEALRAIYWKPAEKITTSTDENVSRYLEILRAENRDELKSLTEKSSAYQLQTINFLLGKNEAELAHRAIENSNFSIAWKVLRNAETSLALKEFGDTNECYFCDALQFESIGEMIRQTPDKKRFLIGDDWFRLTREYGGWLAEKENARADTKTRKISEADRYLTAMLENQPQNAEEQTKLGAFYLERYELKAVIEHLRLAIETDNPAVADNAKLAALGAAYEKIGRRDYAEECWARVLEDGEIKSGAVYFQTVQKYGLSEKAREKLPPIFLKFLTTADADDSPEFQLLIRAVAASFTDEAEKSAYFLGVLNARPTDTSSIYDQENDYKIEEPDGKNFV